MGTEELLAREKALPEYFPTLPGLFLVPSGKNNILNPEPSLSAPLFFILLKAALENIAMPSLISGKSFQEAQELVTSIMKSLNIYEHKDKKPNSMSGGEQQRVAIARALAIKPKIILADEPTGNLDQNTGLKIIDLLFSLNKKNKSSLVIVTHSTELAKKCQRQVKLENGKTIESNR